MVTSRKALQYPLVHILISYRFGYHILPKCSSRTSSSHHVHIVFAYLLNLRRRYCYFFVEVLFAVKWHIYLTCRLHKHLEGKALLAILQSKRSAIVYTEPDGTTQEAAVAKEVKWLSTNWKVGGAIQSHCSQPVKVSLSEVLNPNPPAVPLYLWMWGVADL